MTNLRIDELTGSHDTEACLLEQSCVQGGSLAVRFRRPSFRARSEVYDNALILGGWWGSKLVGTVAGASKIVRLNGELVTAAYFYDLRVHPDYRRRGCARALMRTAVERMGRDADCVYILVAGQNDRMLRLVAANYRYEKEAAIRLRYACLPTFRQRPDVAYRIADPYAVRQRHLESMQPTFVPSYDPERYVGHIESVEVDGAGCSIWSNDNLIAEEIIRLPRPLRMLRVCARTLAPIMAVPVVPEPGEAVRSWFLYDMYADSEPALRRLLRVVNNLALEQERTVVYLLLEEWSETLDWVRRYQRLRITLPYRMLIRGRTAPGGGERIYVDIRDL